jgi:hypothetical protein
VRRPGPASPDVSSLHIQFHFRSPLFGEKLSLEAFDPTSEEEPSGYRFQIIGDPLSDQFALLGKLIEKMRRLLAVVHVRDLACDRCGSMLAHKDARSIVVRTVFGKVDVPRPWLWACSCAAKQGQPRRSVSPLCKAVHQRVTSELEYLRAKWAAHLPYRQATELLREVLPLDKGISFGSTRPSAA